MLNKRRAGMGARGNRWGCWLLCLLPCAGTAWAGCTVGSSGLAFGAYQSLRIAGKTAPAAVTSDATISVTCIGMSSGTNYTIALGPSMSGSGDRISTRYLSNLAGGEDMIFNLFTSPVYATVWGNGSVGGLLSGTIAPGNSNQSHTVYGRIPGGQNFLRSGSFSTSLTMTLTF